MSDQKLPPDAVPAPDPVRRGLLLSGGIAAGMAFAGRASAQTPINGLETDTSPKVLNGQPVPEPPANKSAGPVRPAGVRH